MKLFNRIDPTQTALIVVDVQNDFCHPDGSLAKQGANIGMVDDIISPLNQLIKQAREVGATVIFIQTIHENSTDSATWMRRFKERSDTGVCRKDTWGADFYEVNPENDIVVIKHRYSAFINTRLDSVLRTKNIKTLLMTGVSTNVCVESTARDGFMLDYDVLMLSDCCAAYSEEAHNMTLKNIDDFFGTTTVSTDVLSEWSGDRKVASTL
ncbi:cysteine hydrolase [Aquibacillus koreensis]|uniref:Cysteine hydrolase n=1 Tax=Aquibacillus koreensis TaxID=279446 RepID=A0A9X4AHF1_9BACI|nr:isochorismatase family cysteine hydrolase [Aquibacillus koreensis]MCT2537111.1 cysteine hydrolase [Aquibacillus koreensis]MDC3419906.1 cysteine hydrolase [Aquibacillus koreensis]